MQWWKINIRLFFLYNVAICSILISLKLGSLKGLERKSGFQGCYALRILVKDCRSRLQQCIATAAQIGEVKVTLSLL